MIFILQDLESGLYLKMYGFHLAFYTNPQSRAMKFTCRQQAEDYALEKGIDKNFAAIPLTENLLFHA
jgi:hypothetical protein